MTVEGAVVKVSDVNNRSKLNPPRSVRYDKGNRFTFPVKF